MISYSLSNTEQLTGNTIVCGRPILSSPEQIDRCYLHKTVKAHRLGWFYITTYL